MSDDQIGIAIAVDVGADQSAGPLQPDGTKRSSSSHISEVTVSEIAQQHDFAGAPGVTLANNREIDPAVIVDIDGRDSPAANPLRLRNIDSLESRSTDVLPQSSDPAGSSA